MAISAAEGYSAILSRDNTDLPGHPDKRGVDDDMALSALVVATAGDSKQPKAKAEGHKPFPRKGKKGKRPSRDGPSEDSWVNDNYMREMMVKICEDECSRRLGGGGGGYKQNGYQPQPMPNTAVPPSDLKGFERPAGDRGKEDVHRCCKCNRPGHIRRVGAILDDNRVVTEWDGAVHNPAVTKEGVITEDFHGGPQPKGRLWAQERK